MDCTNVTHLIIVKRKNKEIATAAAKIDMWKHGKCEREMKYKIQRERWKDSRGEAEMERLS